MAVSNVTLQQGTDASGNNVEVTTDGQHLVLTTSDPATTQVIKQVEIGIDGFNYEDNIDPTQNLNIAPGSQIPTTHLSDAQLGGSFKNYGDVWGTMGYTKIGSLVVLQGLMTKDPIASGDIIAVLPPAIRPKQQLVFYQQSNFNAIRVDVCTDGRVICEAASNSWVSLAGIVYSVD